MKKHISYLLAMVAVVGLVGASAPSVYATATPVATSTQSTVQSKANAKALKAMEKEKAKGDREIARRITALTALSDRIGEMKNISDADRSALQSQIKGQADGLAGLQKSIDTETSTSTLKDDLKSVTDTYRIFALVIPQGRIYASIDRMTTIMNTMKTVGQKLQARVESAQENGTVMPTATSTLADFSAKIADIQTQEQAAFALVNNLAPDGGDATLMKANTVALKDARAKIKLAEQDIVSARKDIAALRKMLPKETKTETATSTPATR